MSQEMVDLSALTFIKDTDWRKDYSAPGLPDRVSTLHHLCSTVPVKRPSSSESPEPGSNEAMWLAQTLTTLREVKSRIIKVAETAKSEKGRIERQLIPFFDDQSSQATSTWDILRSFVSAMWVQDTASAKPICSRFDVGHKVISEEELRHRSIPSVDRMSAAATQRKEVITDCETVTNVVEKQIDEIVLLTEHIQDTPIQRPHDRTGEHTQPTSSRGASEDVSEAETDKFWKRLDTVGSAVKMIANSLDPDVVPLTTSIWVPDKGLVRPGKP